jgi:hypothetical protein
MIYLHLLSIPLAFLIAMGKGRKYFLWSIFAVFVGVWALIPLFLLKAKPIKPIVLPAFMQNKVLDSYVRREFKNINTVEDLTKETPNNS